jgi:hypothetical protein
VTLCCQQDDRRDDVRRAKNLYGLDYVEVLDDQITMHVFFVGKLPTELQTNKPGLEQYFAIEGGTRIKDIQILDVDPFVDADPERDDFVVLRLDRYGDFSTYTLRLKGVANVDPRYDRIDFSFKINCPSDFDCLPTCSCEPPDLVEPEINYLARDYQSFRQLIFDRLSVLMPEWTERHAPDIGVALVEILAYTGDYLSYYQDAVATEAYLDTARQRISVRRHARLVDYFLHEGCNARAWVCVEVDADLELDPNDVSFITGVTGLPVDADKALSWNDLREIGTSAYEVFEPLVRERSVSIQLLKAHSKVFFYTWGQTRCCLEKGSTSATLLDGWVLTNGDNPDNEYQKGKEYSGKRSPRTAQKNKKDRVLKFKPGDVLILEEVLGPVTGLPADADPTRRHAVRITSVRPGEDDLRKTEDGLPTPYVEIEWSLEDALPFTFCISAIGAAPDCVYLENVSVARGNTILVDHGKTLPGEPFGPVATISTEAECECVDEAGDVQIIPRRLSPILGRSPITCSASLPQDDPATASWAAARSFLVQDPRQAVANVSVSSQPPYPWESRYDLLGSSIDDKHFVVEIDNFGNAHIRFGNGALGFQPPAGMTFEAIYRVGNGIAGNVGAESISRLILDRTTLSGVSIKVRNPLPARGGTQPEPSAEAKLFAPHAFRKQLQRAIIANDYQMLASRNSKVQRAAGVLVWTGSWFEADVAVDPIGAAAPNEALLNEIKVSLERFRRLGHDLHVETAEYVPLLLTLEVCALPNYQAAHVKAALMDALSNRVIAGGKRGFFHPDNLTFGEGVYLSKIIATAQAVAGVECVRVREFQRLFESPNHEIANGVLPLRSTEIAQLDNDPNFPERGRLLIHMGGGR